MAAKIPRYMYQQMPGYHRYGIDMVRKALTIEADGYRAAGRVDAARALKRFASQLKAISKGKSFADAFDFPPPSSAGDNQ